MTTHPALRDYHRASFRSTWVADYRIRKPENPSRLIVLLHGFSQSGDWIFRKLEPVLPLNAVVLAPCAPFPVPLAEGKLGYSWYFYDRQTDEYVIDMQIGVDYMLQLLQSLKVDQLPTDLIGFSQGGYLAPFLAARLPACQRVTGLACEFLVDEMEFPVRYRLEQIHGESDSITDFARARRAHDRLRERGVQGEFRGVPELGHRIDARVQALVKGLFF